jgi:hypothetical protein
MANYEFSQADADVLNNLMPGNQNLLIGDKIKYMMDEVNSITDTGQNSVKFDNSITPVYGQDNALVSIGTWNTPMTVAPTAAYVPLQVNLTNATNVSGDLAAARLKLITTAACAATNLNVLELRCTIGNNINQWATLQCSCAPAAHTITTGEGLVSYFKMEGSGTITPAGSNAVAVMEVINEHLGGGVSDVAIFRNNATGYGAANILTVENIVGTTTIGINILRTAGTLQYGIAFSGIMESGLNFSAALTSTNTDGTIITTRSTWIDHATAGQCAVKLLCSSSATTGDYATLRIRARSNGASATAGVVGGNFAASANVDNYANLYAVQGYAQPLTKNQSSASNIVCGVYSCVQKTAGTNAGRSWSLWTDTHETVLAAAGHYLHRLSNNGSGINLNGIWTIYQGQGCDYLMNFENNNAPVTAGDKSGGGKDYALAVYINGAVRYIQCYS